VIGNDEDDAPGDHDEGTCFILLFADSVEAFVALTLLWGLALRELQALEQMNKAKGMLLMRLRMLE
jgi:hypothetical protein